MGFDRFKAKSINPRKMVGYRKAGSVVNAEINTSTTTIIKPSILIAELGEAVDVSSNLFIAAINKADGLWYKASSLSTDNLSAKGVFLTGGSTGDTVEVQQTGIVSFIGEDFDTEYPLYLSVGTPNYTQTLLTAKTATEDLRQIIAFPISGQDVLLDIQRTPHKLVQ